MTAREIIYGVIFEPGQTFAYLGMARNKLGLGIIIFTVFSFMASITSHAMDIESKFAVPSQFWGVFWLCKVAAVLLLFALLTGFVSLLAEVFFQRGNAPGLFAIMCYASIPGFLGAPLAYSFTLLGLAEWSALLVLLTGIWVLVLQIMGIKTVLDLDYSQALGLFFSPLFVLILVFILALIVGGVWSILFL